jgi:hypothetical protein
VAVGLTDPHMYFAYCKTEFCLSWRQLADYTDRLDSAHERAALPYGKILYPLCCVIVCHDTRCKESSLTGLLRILGLGRFGEFSTFTFEILSNKLLRKMGRKKVKPGREHILPLTTGMTSWEC